MNQQGDSRTQLHTNTNNVPRGVDTNTGLDNGRRPQDQLATAFRNEGAIQTQPASQNEVAIQKQPAPPPPPPPQDQGAIQTQATPPTPPQFRLRPPSPPPLLPQNQRTLQSQHSPGNITSERVPYGYDKEEQKRIWKNRCLICGRARHDHWKQCDRECYHCREHLGIRGPNVHVGMPCPNTGFNSRWWKDVGGGPIGETNWNKLRVQSLERLLQQKDKKIQKKDKEILQKDEALRRRKEKIIELEGDLDSAKYYIAHELGAVKKESTMQSSQEHIKRLKSELQAAKATEPAMSNPSRNYREREDSLRSRSHTRGNHDERKGRQQSPRHRARHPARSPSRPPDNDAEYQEFLKFKEFQKRAMREGHHDYKASRKSENRSKSPSRERIPYDSDADKEPMKRSAYLDGPNSPPIREYYAPTIAQPDPRTHIFRSGARSQTAFGEQRPHHQQAARRQPSPTPGNYSVSDRQSLPHFNEPLMRNQRSSQGHRQPFHPVVEDDDTFMGGADDDYSEGRVNGKKKKDNYNSRHW